MQEEVRKFFDEFVDAFPSFDGERIASRYLAPYTAIQADGVCRAFTSSGSVSEFFQVVLDDYRARGGLDCRYVDLQTQPLGINAVLGSVTWELVGVGGKVLSRWRESYVLVREAGRLKVRVSVDHA